VTKRPSGKWLSIIIAALVVGGLALYAASAGNKPIPTTAPLQSQAAAPAATATSTALDATPAPAPAPDVSAAPPASGSAVPGMSAGSLISLVLKVGIVAALLALCLWALRKYAGNGPRAGGRTGAIQIVDTISVAQNRAFYVLDVGDRAVVVGATPQQLAVVAEVTDEDVLARLRQKPEPAGAPIAGLWRQFSAMRERQNELRAVAQARASESEAEDVSPAPPRRTHATAPQNSPVTAGPAPLQPNNSASFARTLAAASIAQQAEPAAPRPPHPVPSAAQNSASAAAVTPAAPRSRARSVAAATNDDAERLRALSERLGAAQEPAR